jgi:arylsulfatase A-like enzyme
MSQNTIKGETQRKNILLITSDQQHYMTMGINNDKIKTPNLDKLAARGTVFDRAYTCNPTCTPTRASMITGKYPSQHGAWALGCKLPESEHCVGEDFSQAGYKTALIGKAHFQPLQSTEKYSSLEAYPILQDLDFWRGFNGPFYGFDHIELARNHTDEAHVGQHYAVWMEDSGARNWRDWFVKPTGNSPQSREYTWDIPEKYHYNNWITERTNALLSDYAQNGDNFFLWASFFDPHPSYLVPEPWASMYDPDDIVLPAVVENELADMPPHYALTQLEQEQCAGEFEKYQEPGGNSCHGFHSHLIDDAQKRKNIAVYYGMVSMLDHYIGKILDELDRLGLTEDTLILFTTDHGHFYGQHGLTAKGAFHYEDAIRIPMIASLPGVIGQGQRTDALQSVVDLAPTFLSVAGLEIPYPMTGIDQKDVWFGKTADLRDWAICENHHQPTKLNARTLITARYKITVYCGKDYGELFDLENDPGERINLWNDPNADNLKNELIMKFLQAELRRESMFMPRIAVA